MATRYQIYELQTGVYGTYDSHTEDLPTEFLSGPYNVPVSEANDIKDGASINIIDGEAIVFFEAI